MERKSIHNPSVPASNSHPASSSSPISTIHKKYLKGGDDILALLFAVLALLFAVFALILSAPVSINSSVPAPNSHPASSSHSNQMYHQLKQQYQQIHQNINEDLSDGGYRPGGDHDHGKNIFDTYEEIPPSNDININNDINDENIENENNNMDVDGTAVRSTSLPALQQILTVALEYSVNNKKSINKPYNKDNEHDSDPMYIFECLFHDLCCLASPKLLYLQKTTILQSNQSYSKNDNHNKDNDDEQLNKTSVAINQFNINNSTIDDQKMDNNNGYNIGINNVINSDNDISILESDPSFNNAHLISDLYGNNNLSTLRLLDIDFVIDYVPKRHICDIYIGIDAVYVYILVQSDVYE